MLAGEELVELLIARGADPNQPSSSGSGTTVLLAHATI
jgi:hypothetical protein